MTTVDLEKALAGIQITLSRVHGHLAIAQKRERDIAHAGYQRGYAAGLKAGKDQGFREGWEEAKEFPKSSIAAMSRELMCGAA